MEGVNRNSPEKTKQLGRKRTAKRKITFRELRGKMAMVREEQKSLREVQQKVEEIESHISWVRQASNSVGRPEMEKKMKNFMGARKETGPEVSQKKHRRSRKPKFKLGKPRQVNDKKKKNKKKNQIVATQIAKLELEEFPLISAEIRARKQRLKEVNTEIDGYILDKLATWDAEDKLKLSTI